MKNRLKVFTILEKTDRIFFFLMLMTVGNILSATVKFIFSITIPSLWFGVNAGFGIVLSISRFFSINAYIKLKSKKDEKSKKKIGLKNYLHNGILLILLGIMYFFVSVYMFYKGTKTYMHEYLTYLVALIAFWSVGSAIYGMVKYKRDKSPVIKAVKITNFANALTAIVLTQVTLLNTFSKNYDSVSINGCTGITVSLIIMILGLYMILGIRKAALLE